MVVIWEILSQKRSRSQKLASIGVNWCQLAIGRRRMDMEGIVNRPNIWHYAVRTRPSIS